MRYVMALDQGTSSSRALILDENGDVRLLRQQPFAQHFPKPGWVEHDPQDIWASQLAVAQQVLRDSGLAARQIAAIGVANQRETTLLWDRQTGRPVCPAIVWQDRRTQEACGALRARGLEPLISRKTGLLLDPYFSASKLQWMLDHLPGVRARAEAGALAFGTVDSWIIWNLSGGAVHVTDPSNASRTMLFDLESGCWDEALLEIFGIPAAVLPRICASSGICGATLPELLGAAIPISGIAGDQQAALFGQGCHRAGMAKNTYGTGCFLLLHTGTAPVRNSSRLIATRTAQPGPAQFALEGSVFSAGAAVQWLRDGLGIIGHAAEIEALAAEVEDSGGVFFVPAFTGLGAPYWDPGARGLISGLTRASTRAHLARAALEAIALMSAEVLLAMQADAGLVLHELQVDGGAAANDLLMQTQADVLGVPVVRPACIETTALGAGYLAGLASGVWRSEQELAARWRRGRVFEPAWGAGRRATLLDRWREAVQHALSHQPA
jgi:glycerol kinase